VQGYGPRLKGHGAGVTMVIIWLGVTTCIIHLTFPLISGGLIAASGPVMHRALNDVTDASLAQVCAAVCMLQSTPCSTWHPHASTPCSTLWKMVAIHARA
jgi:hypothetical protein